MASQSHHSPQKPMLATLAGIRPPRPPVWLMRQAGRYLPEYRALRRGVGSFLELCYSPDLAVEITLQPIRRYGFDAAILFSDILVVPDALGADVRFVEGEGPKLEPLRIEADLARLGFDRFHAHLAPVYETVRRLAVALPAEVALIGFAGAPWTLAAYMVEGSGSKEFLAPRRMARQQPELFARLIDLLTEAVTTYLDAQIEAGARWSNCSTVGPACCRSRNCTAGASSPPKKSSARCELGIRTCRLSPSRVVSALPMRRSPVTSRSRESAWIRPCR